ncbi:crotonobetaine/carnitine-CoA ligase [Neobacillus niacini]|uniref:ATP-dependent acyl-CoA ligase n=1 Tax=Neobacillus niacini TaxID=86668 RepID=UPI00286704CA|nr:ATP-dependent acyl-CoA ligase [Neobacillus niacini]MDR7075741.1 crotonobetaine/carnitine-CoA ligase [Neobacillus niacini]
MYTGLKTFGKIVEHRAKEKPDARFIRFENSELTYGEFDRSGNKMANVMKELGLSKGDTCAVMLPNSPEFLAAWLGLAKLGVIEVPVNVSYRGDLLAHILNTGECQALIISSEWVDRVKGISNELLHLRHVIVVGDVNEPMPGLISWHSYTKIMDEASDLSLDVSIQPMDPSLILFTSGTTGPSKGAIISHSANFNLAEIHCKFREIGPNDRLYTVFPLFHSNSRYTTVLPALIADGDVVMHNRFSASRFWDICKEEQITQFNFMGSMLTILLKQPPRHDDSDNPVQQAHGAPIPPEIYEEFQNRFGIKLHEGYGSTETGSMTFNPAESFRKGSCGRPVTSYVVEIHDDNDKRCPNGVVGEIVVRPKEPGVLFSGYYGDPEATVKAWKNLWYHTGDRGYMDEEGYLYFVDRKKDAIRRRGENISSFEVETVLNKHPKVLDSAVVGVPSELTEEEVLAVVVVKDGEDLRHEELLDFCQSRLAHFAVPRYVRFVSDLPRNPSQKVEKYKLREEGITLDTWDRELTGYKVLR